MILAKVANKETASVVTALIKQARKLPRELYQSLTWDRGKELVDHQRFTLATEVDVYFCDPQSPWQRGTNENTNRLLRQYLPKGADLSLLSQAKLSAIARQLNERPRKTLMYQTSAEMFAERVATSLNPPPTLDVQFCFRDNLDIVAWSTPSKAATVRCVSPAVSRRRASACW